MRININANLKEVINELKEYWSPLDSNSYATLLRRCGDSQALSEGKCIHAHIARNAVYNGDTYLGNMLILMYSKCQSLSDVRKVFDDIHSRNRYSWNIMISGYAQNGHLQLAQDTLEKMPQQDVFSWTSMVTAYSENGLVEHVRIIFNIMLERNVVSWTAAVAVYVQTGHVEDAREIFEKMPQRDVPSWNAMIAGYAQIGDMQQVCSLFYRMPGRDVISWNTFVSAYAHNGQLQDVLQLFSKMPQQDVVSWNSLIQAYINNGSMTEANFMFLKAPQRSNVSWNAMIQAYARFGHTEHAERMFAKMPQRDLVSSTSMIQSYSDAGRIVDARRLFNIVPQRHVISWTAMLMAYVQEGKVQDARSFFNQMPQWNIICCTAMMCAYCQHGHIQSATALFYSMPQHDAFTCNVMITGYAQNGFLPDAKDMFSNMPQLDATSWTAIIHAYALNGQVDEARQTFERMAQRDVISWNVMIAAYAQNGYGRAALDLFRQMDLEGEQPNQVAVACIFDACASIGAIKEGRRMHAEIVDSELPLDVVGCTALVNMYATCGCLKEAANMFKVTTDRDVVSWNAMIVAFAHNGHAKEAVDVFREMDIEGVKPDEITYVSVLDACANAAALSEGSIIHASMLEEGVQTHEILGTALVNMYGSCGLIDEAMKIFEQIPERDVPFWNSMISQSGHSEPALKLFRRMLLEGMKPDETTYSKILSVCTELSELMEISVDHTSAFQSDLLGTALVNMYGKCGRLDEARNIFNKTPRQDVAAWNAMIAAYAHNGLYILASDLFQIMQLEGMSPDEVTFVCMIFSCSHQGMLEEARRSFLSIEEDYGIVPALAHYMCMLDLVGRTGQVKLAQELINSMPFEPLAVAWTTLLGACRIHGDVEHGKNAAQYASQLDPGKSAPYILLSNMHMLDP